MLRSSQRQERDHERDTDGRCTNGPPRYLLLVVKCVLSITQMASLTLARLNPLTFNAGTTMGAETELFSLAATRVGRPSISTFCRNDTID